MTDELRPAKFWKPVADATPRPEHYRPPASRETNASTVNELTLDGMALAIDFRIGHRRIWGPKRWAYGGNYSAPGGWTSPHNRRRKPIKRLVVKRRRG